MLRLWGKARLGHGIFSARGPLRRHAGSHLVNSPAIAVTSGYCDGINTRLSFSRTNPKDWSATLAAMGVGLLATGAITTARAEESSNAESTQEELPKKTKGQNFKYAALTASNYVTGMAYRQHRISEYEDRLRRFSPPEKLFRYFATLVCEDEVYMTIDDLMRSLVRGEIQPADLRLDNYREVGRAELKTIKSKFKLHCLGNSAGGQVLNFAEYLFLVTVLLVPMTNFEIAFKMFDLDGNGTLEPEEFVTIFNVLLKQSRFGRQQKAASGAPHFKSVNESFVLRAFFGPDGSQTLSLERFREFVVSLKHEVHTLEYTKVKGDADMVSQRMVAHALTQNIRNKNVRDLLIKRAELVASTEKEVSLDDWLLYRQLGASISALEAALALYSKAGKSIDIETFARACRAVTDQTLSDDMLQLIFNMFDLDGDGDLSWKELALVMKADSAFGLNTSRDVGLWRGLKGLVICIRGRLKEDID